MATKAMRPAGGGVGPGQDLGKPAEPAPVPAAGYPPAPSVAAGMASGAEKVLRLRQQPPPAPKQPQVRTQTGFEDQYGSSRHMLTQEEAYLYKTPQPKASRRPVPTYTRFIQDSHAKLLAKDDSRGKAGRAHHNQTDVLNVMVQPSATITGREEKVRMGRKPVVGFGNSRSSAEANPAGARKKETPLDTMKADKQRAGQRSVRDAASDGMPLNIVTWANAGDALWVDKKVSDDARMHAAEARRQQRAVPGAIGSQYGNDKI